MGNNNNKSEPTIQSGTVTVEFEEDLEEIFKSPILKRRYEFKKFREENEEVRGFDRRQSKNEATFSYIRSSQERLERFKENKKIWQENNKEKTRKYSKKQRESLREKDPIEFYATFRFNSAKNRGLKRELEIYLRVIKKIRKELMKKNGGEQNGNKN